MVLYITLDTGKTSEWHVGTAMPVTGAMVTHVTEVQADGDELFRIIMKFENLPRASTGSYPTRWFGDHARFIVANIRG